MSGLCRRWPAVCLQSQADGHQTSSRHSGSKQAAHLCCRAATCRALADPAAQPADFNRPGHVATLRAREGGVLNRRGHTEAAVDMAALAGRFPAGVLCEIVDRSTW